MIKQAISDKVFILDAGRTVSASPFKSLKEYSSADLVSAVLSGILKRNNLDKNYIDQVIIGNALAAGRGQNIARQASVKAGLPVTVNSYSIDDVCASGLQAVISATLSIVAGNCGFVFAGGAESISKAPFLSQREAFIKKESFEPIDSLKCDGLFCDITKKRMGELAEDLARKQKISREKQDEYALGSHQRACRAIEQGAFLAEILSVGSDKSGKEKDDRPRAALDMEILRNYPPAFDEKGTVTAGNSSVPTDAAAAVLLCSKAAFKKVKIKPIAQILGYSSIMIDPVSTFEASVISVEECLRACRLRVKDIDLFEIAEAFAVQAIYSKEALGIPDEKYNVNGGDVALGHPLGAVGARILATLIHSLKNKKLKRGIASVPFGGGGAVTVLIETM
ncbi:MAG: thiolase family protein [Candidatus Omnitrophica bacterium]|nr:thiolase family protein [Candidatus Omnitrophota bacterium]